MAKKKVIIVGGGISGLAAAYRLHELSREKNFPLEITVLEAKNRLGGVIETEDKEGFLMEGGPDSFISEKPWGIDLCNRLGIAGHLIETCKENRQSFILRQGRLIKVPQGLYLTVPSRILPFVFSPIISWRGKLRMVCDLFVSPRKEKKDESVADFMRRRFGEEALNRIAQPMIGGIYTADPEKLSMQTVLPHFQEMEREYGSLIRGFRAKKNQNAKSASGPRYSLFLSLREGMGMLIQALVNHMSDVTFKISAPVAKVERKANWRIFLQNKERLEADAVCLALGTQQAAPLLDSVAPELAEDLKTIPYESVATMNLAFRRSQIPQGLKGFGFVIPAVENRQIVGLTFSSMKFAGRAPEDYVLMRAFVGGALHRGMANLKDADMEKIVLEELIELFGIRATPVFISIHRYAQAMPQYRVGHLNRVHQIENDSLVYPGLYLTGNGYGGIGIPDCIRQAERKAEEILNYLMTPMIMPLEGY